MRPSERLRDVGRQVLSRVLGIHRAARSFEDEARAAGGVGGGHDVGNRPVPTSRIVGSVGRWQNLRSDFFYRKGGVTQRFIRVGQAMRKGVTLPPIQVYKLRKPPVKGVVPPSEYYVVDGHHRVAMARKFGQDYLDAEVREFTVRGGDAEPEPMPPPASPDRPAEGMPPGGSPTEGR